MGLTKADAVEIIFELIPEDFYRAETSYGAPQDLIWTFTPPYDDDLLWIRLCIRDGLVVISFHIDGW